MHKIKINLLNKIILHLIMLELHNFVLWLEEAGVEIRADSSSEWTKVDTVGITWVNLQLWVGDAELQHHALRHLFLPLKYDVRGFLVLSTCV